MDISTKYRPPSRDTKFTYSDSGKTYIMFVVSRGAKVPASPTVSVESALNVMGTLSYFKRQAIGPHTLL